MFTHPYTTTPCRGYRLDSILHELKRAMIDEALTPAFLPKGDRLPDIWLVTPRNPDIPPFAHPLPFQHQEREVWAIDVRGQVRISRMNDELVVTASMDYEQSVIRTLLARHWKNHGSSDLAALGPFPAVVFTRWVAENIARRLTLDPAAQLRLTAIVGFYYHHRFIDATDWGTDSVVKIATHLGRHTRIPTSFLIEVGEQLPYMASASELVDVIQKHGESMRFERFNLGLLYSMFMGAWFGANSREIVAVALEHPPTFMSLIYMALKERSYRKTQFAQVVLVNDKQDAGRTFTYNLLGLINHRG